MCRSEVLRQLHGRRRLRHDRARLRDGRALWIPILTVVLDNSSMAIEIPHLVVSHDKYRTRDINPDTLPSKTHVMGGVSRGRLAVLPVADITP